MKQWCSVRFGIALIALELASSPSSAQTVYTPYAFTNFAGQPGVAGFVDGSGNAAQFYIPHSVAVDAAGNLYVGDTFNHAIRKITPAGEVTTVAGSGGKPGYGDGVGTAEAPQFNSPIGLAVDGDGNLYLADNGNQTIRKVTPAATVTTFAGQVGVRGSANATGTAASFNGPNGTAVDGAGNIYVSDQGSRTIRKITSDGAVTTLAGSTGLPGTNDGLGSAARFYGPDGVAVDKTGNVYVADGGGHTIRKITPNGLVTTLAGTGHLDGSNDGLGGAARFKAPTGVAVDKSGNVYVADTGNNTIRRVTPAGSVTTLAGSPGQTGSTDGTNGVALFSAPSGIAVDGATNLYVSANSTIRKLTPVGTNWVVTTLAGTAGQNGSVDATGSAARFHGPYGVAVDKTGNVYAVDRYNDDIRKITPAGVVTTFAGVPRQAGSVDGTGAAAQFDGPEQLTVDPDGNLYVVEFFNNTVRKIAPVGTHWVVTTVAGCASCAPGTNDGPGLEARFNSPFGLTRDPSGNLYVADTSSFTIRKIAPSGSGWVVTTFAGAPGRGGAVDGTGNEARFGGPIGLAADSAGNIYLVDGFAIRSITPGAKVATLAGCPPPGCLDALGSTDGSGSVARFNLPRDLAVDGAGNIYVADSGNNLIRKLTRKGADWTVTTLAGSPGLAGAVDGVGANARFNAPTGVAVDKSGNVYVVDSRTFRIARGTPASGGTVVQFDTSSGGLTFSNGFFQMRVAGPSTGGLVLEASTDLQSWTPIQTNSFSSGLVVLSVPLKADPYSFFRVRLTQ